MPPPRTQRSSSAGESSSRREYRVVGEHEVCAQAQRCAQAQHNADRCKRKPLTTTRARTPWPIIATPAPISTGLVGAVRSATVPEISSTGAENSSSRATPTDRYCNALK